MMHPQQAAFLLTAGPAGWTTLGWLLGTRPLRAPLVAALDLHGCWTPHAVWHPWARAYDIDCGYDDKRQDRRCTGCHRNR